MEKNLIPSPSEMMKMKNAVLSPVQEELIQSLVNVLKGRYSGKSMDITLKEIKSGISESLQPQVQSSDRDVLETQMLKSGRKMVYDGPAYNESYDSTYKISENK